MLKRRALVSYHQNVDATKMSNLAQSAFLWTTIPDILSAFRLCVKLSSHLFNYYFMNNLNFIVVQINHCATTNTVLTYFLNKLTIAGPNFRIRVPKVRGMSCIL